MLTTAIIPLLMLSERTPLWFLFEKFFPFFLDTERVSYLFLCFAYVTLFVLARTE